MKTLISKTLYDKRWFILGWTLGLIFFGWLMMVFYPTFSGDQMKSVVDAMPASVAGLIGNLADFNDPTKYMASQVFDIRLPMIVAIFVVILAVSLTVGEESRGNLRTLLVTPLSRTRILFEKWLAIVLISIVATVAVGIGVCLGLIQTGVSPDWGKFIALLTMLVFQIIAMATVVFGIGFATGRSGLTITISTLVMVESYIISTFAIGVAALKNWEWLSLFKYFPASDVVKTGLDWGGIAVYLGITVVFLVLGLVIFRRRDVD